jgi:transposase InsO family protein
MISAQDRQNAVQLIIEAAAAGARANKACACLGIAYSSYLKWLRSPSDKDKRPERVFADNSRALSPAECEAVFERFCQSDVCDLSVRQAFFKLLDQGEYLASESTVYRILRKRGANKRRDGVRASSNRHRPTSYEATGPNQVWTWDITYMRDAEHSTRFYYVFAVIDVYSRYLVHCDVFGAETAENAVQFLTAAMDKHRIRPRCLVLHSDNGASMKAAKTLGLLAAREVEFSHSRPRVSNDNPYSESLFKTMKYTGYMGKKRFRSLEACKAVMEDFARKYNEQWVHSGISNVTPGERFRGADAAICEARRLVLEQARLRHPDRWIGGRIMRCEPAGSQWLNPARKEGA